MTHDESESLLAERAGELVTAHVSDGASVEQHEQGKRRFVSALSTQRRSRSSVTLLALAAALTVLLAGAWLYQRRAANLSYEVANGSVSDGGYIQSSGGDAARLSFSDGTRVDLDKGSRGRVAAIDARGARLALENGHAALSVVHRAQAQWFVDAGPYVIRVTGTAFDVSWSSSEESLVVELRQGSVVVSGPPSPSGVVLRAGQRLSARDGQMTIGPLQRQAEPAPAAEPQAPSEEPSTLPERGESARAAQATSWPKAVAAGDYQLVLSEAEKRGLQSCYAQATLGELVALADAARYAKRHDIAQAALSAQRSRFAGSSSARTAAFLLGRLADDAGSQAEALKWYDRYLREAPSGPLAPEALGRKMIALRSLKSDAAREVAQEYLRRFPDGPYRARALELTATKGP
jgi:TolA-binding protein